jgi:hypothetical protein
MKEIKKIIINCKLADFQESKFYFIKRKKYFEEVVLNNQRFKIMANGADFGDFLLQKIGEKLGINEFFLINYAEEKKYFGKTKTIMDNLIAYKI